jgi:tetratricopeptide (TPR) repeat protein
MTRRLLPVLLGLPALALVAAGPAAVSPDELVRQANGALGRKQYIDALKLYERAEERATDPGLVAFDEGVALYQKGDFAEAEVRFRLARQDRTAPSLRPLYATYNLAASIVQLPGDGDPAKLAEAVRLFEECLRDGDLDERLAADARHNLELAKMLWAQAKARPARPKNERPPDDPEENSKPPQPRPEPQPQPGAGEGSASPTKGNAERTPVTQEQGTEPIKTDGQQAAGAGNLPVIPDRDELTPMSREEAEAHLRQAIEKVMQEGRAHRQRAQKAPSGKVRDW